MLNLTPETKKSFLILTLIGLLTGILGTYSRLYPLRHYVSFEANEQASMLVIRNLQKTVAQSSLKEKAAMGESNWKMFIKKRFDALLRSEQGRVREAIYKTARQIDAENPYNQKYPYLLASDSYYYYGLTKTIQKTGKIGSQVRGSKFFHPLMLAPLGYWEPLNLHPYIGLGIHKLISLVNPEAPLMFSVSFTNMALSLLTLIPFLGLCAFFRCSGWSAWVGATYFFLTPIFLKRSCFAWYDDDVYNVFFPLLVLLLVFYALRHIDSTRRWLLGLGLAVLSITLYAFFWQGWVFLATVVALSLFLIFLCSLLFLKDPRLTKNLGITVALLAAGLVLGVGAIFGIKDFFALFQEGWIALKNFIKPAFAAWPDMYISVGELHKTPLKELIELTSGSLFFVIAFLGLISRGILSFRAKRNDEIFGLLTLGVLLAATLVMSLGAQRFVLLCFIPLSIFFTLGIETIFSGLNHIVSRRWATDRYLPLKKTTLCLVIAMELILLQVKNAEDRFPSLLNPIFNSTWNRALVQIKDKTPLGSVINTWWPPGHFIKGIAERSVTFDGATINKPQAYWMANVFLATDERAAAGLLRMLNNSANEATEYLQSAGFDLADTVDLLKKITPLGRRAAETQLQKTRLASGQIGKLLELTHASPPPTYLLIYNDLVEKSLQLTFVGNWNFREAAKVNQDPALRKAIKKLSQPNYVKFLWKIAGGGPPRTSDPLPLLGMGAPGMIFSNGVTISLDKQCRINSDTFGRGIPLSLLYSDGKDLIEKTFEKQNLSYSVLLYRDGGTYSCVLLERNLAYALIMRLYYLDGVGLKYFKPFTKEVDLTRRTQILVYQVDWERFISDSEGLAASQ